MRHSAKRGMTLAEYNKLGETDPSTDIEVDEYQKKLGETEDNFIIEGRTSWHFIPHSLKFLLMLVMRWELKEYLPLIVPERTVR